LGPEPVPVRWDWLGPADSQRELPQVVLAMGKIYP
jgi:hypothetical protein